MSTGTWDSFYTHDETHTRSSTLGYPFLRSRRILREKSEAQRSASSANVLRRYLTWLYSRLLFFHSKLSPNVICSHGSLFAAGLPGIPRRIAAVAVPGCLVSLQFEHLVRLDEKCIIAIPHLCVDPHAHVRVEGKVSEVVGPLPLLAVPRATLPPAALEVRQVLVVGVA